MSTSCTKFVLVVPTLNEAGNIKMVLDRATTALRRVPMPWEICVVDDQSSDGTEAIVREYSQSDNRVRLLIRQEPHGLAGAISYGWVHSDANLLGVMDADLQHPPELLPTLLNELCSGSDIAIASRYVRPHCMDEWNILRRAISRVSVLVSGLVQRRHLRVEDPMSGFFVLRRECIEGLNFQPAGFKLLLEILAKGRIKAVREVPFKFAVRRSGQSKAGVMTGFHYLTLLIRLFLKRNLRIEPHF